MFLIAAQAYAEPARQDCSDDEIVKAVAIGVSIGAGIGIAVGLLTAAYLPVGSIGGPAAITYFPGKPAFGNWIKVSVVPLAATSGVLYGMLGGLLAHANISSRCTKYIEYRLSQGEIQ
jgi:hypothetical protein